MTALPATLRKAAILISSLDSRSADALLDQMDEQQAARVRGAIMQLDDIDPHEQQRVIADFLRTRHRPAQPVGGGVEIDASLAARMVSSPATPTRSAATKTAAHTAATNTVAPGPVLSPANGSEQAAAAPPFRFLDEARADELAEILAHEHPQTTAVVASHLSPACAAAMFRHLPRALRAEVLRRVADLDHTDPDVLLDVERTVRAALAERLQLRERRAAGLTTVRAILDAVDSQERRDLVTLLTEQDRELATLAGVAEQAAEGPEELSLPSTRTERVEPVEEAEPSESRLEFDELETLDDRALARVLRSTDRQTLLIALSGAPPALIARLVKPLPAKDARIFRQRLERLGPIRLKDIELAQRTVARRATEILAPKPRLGFSSRS